MNEFKQQILETVKSSPGLTVGGVMDDLFLDTGKKPKVARILSELKNEGYVTSEKGEHGLLEWLACKPLLDKVCPKPDMKFNVKPVKLTAPDPEPEIEAEVTPMVVSKKPTYSHSGSSEQFKTLSECTSDAKYHVCADTPELQVFEIHHNHIASVKFIPADVELVWVD